MSRRDDLDAEHHRVAGHDAGVELAEGTGDRRAEDGRVQQRARLRTTDLFRVSVHERNSDQ
jgi:hypothetical protein